MQLELAALRELAKAGAQADEIGSCDRYGQFHGRLGHIEDTVLLETEAVRFVLPVDEMHDVFALEMFVGIPGVDPSFQDVLTM